jgi:hypothetical protein
MTWGEFKELADNAWRPGTEPSPRQIDWLGLERDLVAVLDDKKSPSTNVLDRARELLDAYTGRAHFLDRFCGIGYPSEQAHDARD